MSELFVDAWGSGTPVVLGHCSLATGQKSGRRAAPLAGMGFRVLAGAALGRHASERPQTTRTVAPQFGHADTSIEDASTGVGRNPLARAPKSAHNPPDPVATQ